MAENPIKNTDFYAGDGKPFEQVIKNIIALETQAEKTLTKIIELGKALKSTGNPTDAASIKEQVSLMKQLETEQKKLLQIEQQRADAEKELAIARKNKIEQDKLQREENKKLTTEYQKQSRQLNDLRKEYKDLALAEKENTKEAKDLLKQITQLDKKLKDVDATVGQHQRNVGNYTKSLKGLGAQLLGAFGIVGAIEMFASAIKKIITNNAQFEQSLKTMQSVIGGTDEEMRSIAKTAQEVGAQYGKGAIEIANMQIELGKLGLTAKEINGVTGSIVALSVATGEDLVKSGEIAASTMRQFGMQSADMIRITDVMTKSFNASALGLEEFGLSMKYVGPVAKAVGFSLEDVTAMLGVLADAGIKGEAAGTSLRFILTTVAEKGGDAKKAFAELSKSGITTTGALDEVGRNAMTAMQVLAANMPKLERFTNEMNNAAGATKETATAMGDTMLGAWNRMTSAISNSLFFEWMSGWIKYLLNGFTELFGGMDEVADKVKEQTALQIAEDRKRIMNAKEMEKERQKVIKESLSYIKNINNELSKAETHNNKQYVERLRSDRKVQTERLIQARAMGQEVKDIEINNTKVKNQLLEEAAKKREEYNKKEIKALESKAKKEKEIREKAEKEAWERYFKSEQNKNKNINDAYKYRNDAIKEAIRVQNEAQKNQNDKDIQDAIELTDKKNQLRKDFDLMSIDETYERKKDAITSSAEFEILNEKDKNKILIQLEQEKYKAKFEQAQVYANASIDILDTVSTFQEAAMNRELAAAGDNEAKKEEIRKKYAKKEQQNAIAKAVINGALAVGNALVSTPFPAPALIFAAIAAAQTAAQVYLIKSQKFAKGGSWIEGGRLHSQGGNKYGDKELEKGEAVGVLSRKATAKHGKEFMSIVDAFNSGRPELLIPDINVKAEGNFKELKEIAMINRMLLNKQTELNSHFKNQLRVLAPGVYLDGKGNKINIV